MNSMRDAFGVCVIGGGPAGAVIAARLREYGLSVALLEGSTRSGWSCGYSIPAAASEWLRATGWPIDLERAGALRLQGASR